jgi:hypothetical protein
MFGTKFAPTYSNVRGRADVSMIRPQVRTVIFAHVGIHL